MERVRCLACLKGTEDAWFCSTGPWCRKKTLKTYQSTKDAQDAVALALDLFSCAILRPCRDKRQL